MTETPSSGRQVKVAGSFHVERGVGKRTDPSGWLGYIGSIVVPNWWMLGLVLFGLLAQRWAAAQTRAAEEKSGIGIVNVRGTMTAVGPVHTPMGAFDPFGTYTPTPVVFGYSRVTETPSMGQNVAVGPVDTPTSVYVASATPVVLIPSPYPTGRIMGGKMDAYYSWYWPPLGGINCRAGDCSTVANGDKWEKWVGRGLACPVDFALGTKFYVDDQEWVCVDRGSKIVMKNGKPWLDFLTAYPAHGYGSVISVQVEP